MFGKRVKIWSNYNGYIDPKLILDEQELEFVNMSPNKDPYYEYEGDSGFDLRAWITKEEDGAKIDKEDNKHFITLKPLERRMIHTGLYFKLPAFTEIQVRPRSGCSIKEGFDGYQFARYGRRRLQKRSVRVGNQLIGQKDCNQGWRKNCTSSIMSCLQFVPC